MSELEEDIRILEELLALKKKQRGNWRAEVSEIYWYVDDTGGTCEEEEQNDDIDDRYHKIGNYFRSEEEAKNSDLFFYMNCRYHFWIPDSGMPKPEEIPKGCEIHMGAGSWGEAFIEPKDWKDGLFRWPKA